MPLIISGGDVVPGECTALVSATDLFGTIGDLAGVHWAAEDSVSLSPYLAGDLTPLRSTVYAEDFSPNFISPDVNGQPPFAPTVHTRAIRNERYKLIRFTTATGAQEELFFDLQADPCETVNLCPGFGHFTASGMNATDLRTLDDKGLLVRQQDLLGELTSLKFQKATGQLDNTAAVRHVRRALARVNTLIREREIEVGLAAGGLVARVGPVEAEASVFASFRKFMGQS